MASLKVEVISSEIIKPSSPTPPHLNTVQLSFIDQFVPPVYIPLIFFYQNDPSHVTIDHNEVQRSVLLKKSLSDTLVRFYPLAGRVNGNISIDCNDEGVEFYEANVSINLFEVIEKPNLEDLRGLLPFEPAAHDKSIVLGVQVNHFSCGGMAISVCISHKIADGTALVDFVRAWATMTRGVEGDDDNVLITCPKFDGASYFPPRDFDQIHILNTSIQKEKIVTRRLVFDKERLDALKEQVTKNLDGIILQEKAPTRVEVVSAFLWKHFMEATRRANNSSLGMMFAAFHVVNLRNRRRLPIPKDSFGNFWWPTMAPSSPRESNNKLPELASMLREAIRKISNNFIEMLEDYDNTEFLSMMKKPMVGFEEGCSFSSWCRFPMYEVNFGWGEPAWVCTSTLPFKNTVILLSTKCGEGIEAWVNMLEDDIAMLEQDLELFSVN